MSELRQQLETLGRIYAADRYPADLAAQLLDRVQLTTITRTTVSKRSIPWRMIFGGAGGALAASIGLMVLLYEPAENLVQNSVARLSSATKLPFFEIGGPTAGGNTEEPFTIIPEFHPPDVSGPSDVSIVPVGDSTAVTCEVA